MIERLIEGPQYFNAHAALPYTLFPLSFMPGFNSNGLARGLGAYAGLTVPPASAISVNASWMLEAPAGEVVQLAVVKILIVLVVAAFSVVWGPSIFHAYIHPRDAAGLLAAACEANPHRDVFILTRSKDSSGILGCEAAKRVKVAEVEHMEVTIYESRPVALLFGRSVHCLYLREPPKGARAIECNSSVDAP